MKQMKDWRTWGGVPVQVGARIRLLREQRGWSAATLAAKASVDPATLSRIERGLADPRQTTLEGIAKALGVPLSSLLADDIVGDEAAGADVMRYLTPQNRREVLDFAWYKLMKQQYERPEAAASAGAF